MHGIIQYVLFFPPTFHSASLFRDSTLCAIDSSFLFVAECSSIVGSCHALFIHSLADGNLNCSWCWLLQTRL